MITTPKEIFIAAGKTVGAVGLVCSLIYAISEFPNVLAVIAISLIPLMLIWTLFNYFYDKELEKSGKR